MKSLSTKNLRKHRLKSLYYRVRLPDWQPYFFVFSADKKVCKIIEKSD